MRTHTWVNARIATAAIILATTRTYATTGTWLTTNGGSWSTAANWSSNPNLPTAADDTANFSSNTILSQSNVTISSAVTLGTLNFDINAYALSLTGAGSLTFNNGAARAAINVNQKNTFFTSGTNTQLPAFALSSPLTITYNIINTATYPYQLLLPNLSTSQPIEIDGTGIVTMPNGASPTFTSPLVINGTYYAASNTAFGSATGTDADGTTVNPGGTVVIVRPQSGTEKLTLAGSTLADALLTSAFPTFSGNISLTADSGFTRFTLINPNQIPHLTLNGVISGVSNLTVSSSLFITTAASTLSGRVILNTGGELAISTTGSFLNVPEFDAVSGTLNVSRPAGSNTSLNSIQPHSVILTGGALALSADLEPTQFLSNASTGGMLAINCANYTAGGTNLLDLNAIPGGQNLQIGTTYIGYNGSGSSIASSVSIIPNNTTHTLQFAGGEIFAPIHDFGSNRTNVIISGNGVLTAFDGTTSYSGTTTITPGGRLDVGVLPTGNSVQNDGTLYITGPSTAGQITGLGNLSISSNTTLAPSVGPSKPSSLSLSNGTQLNLTNNPLIIEAPTAGAKSADMTQLASEITSGKNGGLWNGPGITSSTVAARPNQLTLVLADNALLNVTSLGGQSLDANSILIVPTYFGDANLDGHVDLTDLSTILNHFGTTTPNWTDGNFDGQPTIDLTDLSDVLNNFGLANPDPSNAVLSTQSSLLPVPEPTSFILLSAALLIKTRRRRARQSRP
jgi:fibronectin-binding autotransporter adhesin